MPFRHRIFALGMPLVATVALGGCATAQTSAPTDVGATSATLNGSLRSSSTAGTDSWFEYGTTTAYGSVTPTRSMQLPQAQVYIPVSGAVDGLTPATTYHVRLCTREPDMGNAICGGDQLLSTAPAPQLSATTDPPTDVSDTAATLPGHITSGGLPFRSWFDHGTTSAYGSTTPQQDGAGASQVSQRLTGLAPGAYLHYRVCASDAIASRCGADRTVLSLWPTTPDPRYAPRTDLVVGGHSWVNGPSTHGAPGPASSYQKKLAHLLYGADETENWGVAGSALSRSTQPGGIATWLQALTRGTDLQAPNPHSTYLLGWGLNDSARLGPNRTPYFAALATAVARARSSAVFEAGPTSDPTIAFGGDWTDVSATDGNSGSGFRRTSLDGSTVTITVPGTFLGGSIDLGFVTGPSSGGSVSISVAAAVGQTASEDLSGAALADVASASPALTVHRLSNLAPGAQTITLGFTGLTGNGIGFDYWEAESPAPPLCVISQFARVPAPDYWTKGGYAYANADNLVATYRAALDRFTADWGAGVIAFDADAALNDDPSLFSPDGVHPNDDGHTRLAEAAATAIAAAG